MGTTTKDETGLQRLERIDRFKMHTQIASDTPQQLRAVDVQRLIDELPNGLDLGAYLAWLSEHQFERPRTAVVIASAMMARLDAMRERRHRQDEPADPKDTAPFYDPKATPPLYGKVMPEHAIGSEAFPCNPRPFARRIDALCDEHGPDAIRSDAAKACLVILVQLAYEQLATLDTFAEGQRLIGVFPPPAD